MFFENRKQAMFCAIFAIQLDLYVQTSIQTMTCKKTSGHFSSCLHKGQSNGLYKYHLQCICKISFLPFHFFSEEVSLVQCSGEHPGEVYPCTLSSEGVCCHLDDTGLTSAAVAHHSHHTVGLHQTQQLWQTEGVCSFVKRATQHMENLFP